MDMILTKRLNSFYRLILYPNTIFTSVCMNICIFLHFNYGPIVIFQMIGDTR